MDIPLADLKVQYTTIKREVDAAIQSVIDETAFVKGCYVKAFEESLQKKTG